MQPDRACYIRRAADEQLIEAIASQRFASVFAPRATGKSSLMSRAMRRLRAEGQLAAVVDLGQIGARGESVDAARWHYSIAYRICRELRLKIDLQAWWHDKSLLLSEQRLAEFFFDVVLGHTQEPVTIFLDEAERAVDLPFAVELFLALNSCYLRRVSEPESARLNFVVLGATSAAQLCPIPGVSPFEGGAEIRLEDFTLAECAGLAPGLAGAEAPASALLARIHVWTRGQPYLTQKLARGVARKGGRLSDVDAALHELFLAPGISREEPLLGHMHERLSSEAPRSRQARRILARLARGTEVIDDPVSAGQSLLELAGLVSSDDNGMLRYRNRIVEHIFGADWARDAVPRRWQRPARRAALVAGLLVLLPYWYVEMLPARDIETLTGVSSDYELALEAHRRLSRLPGFGRRADRLLAEVMVRRSEGAATIEEVLAADAVLRELRDGAGIADGLQAAFWLRRAEGAARRGERDSALVHALVAAEVGSTEAAAFAASLVDGDYTSLERSYHLEQPPLAVEVDWEREVIVIVDETRRVRQLALAPGGAEGRTPDLRLTALQHVGVTRSIFVDDPGRAAALELRIGVEHPRPGDLLVRLQAPSGAAAELPLPSRAGGPQQYVLRASAANGLLALADESILGDWELTVFDRLDGEAGTLHGWGLRFAGVPQVFDDEPDGGIALPDPVRTEQIAVTLSDDGRLAVALPSRADARGAASVWNLASGMLVGDLPLGDRVSIVEIVGSERVLVAGLRQATLWRTDELGVVAERANAAGFAARPVVSADERFVAMAEWAEGVLQATVLDARDGSVVGSFAAPPWRDWALGTEAALVALVDGSRRGRLIDARSGADYAEFYHEREIDRVALPAGAGRVLGIDRAGEIFAWPIPEATGRTLSPRDSIYVGAADAVASLDIAGEAGVVAYAEAGGLVSVRRTADGVSRGSFDHGSARGIATRLSDDASRLVSISDELLRAWRIRDADPAGIDFGDVSAVALGSRGELAGLGYRSGAVRFLEGLPGGLHPGAAAGELVIGHRGVVTTLALDASGRLAASGSSDGSVRIWETASGTRQSVLLRHPSGPIGAVAFSPDGAWLVSAGPTSARVFAVASGEFSTEIEVEGTPLAVAFSPDSRLVAVGDSAGNIFLAAPGRASGVAAIRGLSPITALAFGDEPGLLASGSRDGDLVLWDTLTREPIEGAHRFPAAIGWIGHGLEGGEIRVRSGAWLHALERGSGDDRVGVSRLLPREFRHAPALTLIGDGRLRGLANAGGGRLVLRDFDAAPRPAAALPADRDWNAVLGLTLDPGTGRLERTLR